MDKEQLKQLATNAQFIPGIYNYCDRWCERCMFVSRCLNFAMGEEQSRDPDARDPQNEAFWKKIEENFRLTLELLMESLAEYGIDANELDLEEGAEENKRAETAARSHPLAGASQDYIDLVDNWMESARGSFEQKETDLNTRVQLDIDGMQPYTEAVAIEDAIEVIHWYQYFIHIKLMRALQGREDRGALAEDCDLPKDSDGSAKIALIAMDRSIGAWTALRKHLPEQDNAILDVLLLLGRLRAGTEREFPEARGFLRPGFDYMPEPDEEPA